MRVPSLQQFFRRQLQHAFQQHGLTQQPMVEYVSDLLTRFAQTRALYPIRDAQGQWIDTIVDLLIEKLAKDRARARAIIEHIGEYTLFMSGLFRERLQARGQLNYYLAHGRNAYWQCADVETNPRQRQVYQRLYQEFEAVSDVLDYLRREQFPVSQDGDPNLLAGFWRIN